MISVMIKIIGQVSTPADITSERLGTPNKLISNFLKPNVSSTLNNFTPINSDNIAFATKKLPRKRSKRLSLVLKVIAYKSKDKSNEIKKFVNENRLRYNDKYDLIQIINYYNSIKTYPK